MAVKKANPKKYINRFLPEETKGKYEIINGFTGKPLESDGSIFKVGSFPEIDVKTLNQKKIDAFIKQKHPSIRAIKS